MIAALATASATLKTTNESRPKKVGRLRSMFDQPELLGPLKHVADGPPLLMPLNPSKRLLGSVPERATVFKYQMPTLT